MGLDGNWLLATPHQEVLVDAIFRQRRYARTGVQHGTCARRGAAVLLLQLVTGLEWPLQ